MSTFGGSTVHHLSKFYCITWLLFLQAVPAYIEKVNWGSLAESLEVYSLLDQIAEARQEFPVEVSSHGNLPRGLKG